MVKPDGPLIRISQIRELRHQLAMRPYEGRMRVVIIAGAHTMNPEAANALLKALEEPPAGNLFVLTTAQTSDLLPTIVSRCQQVCFGRLAASEIAQLLTQQGQVAAKDAETLAMLAQGSMAKAVDMGRKHGLHRREWLIAELEQLHNRPINALLALSERLAQHKDTLDAMLGICQTWFRDLLVYSLAPATIINKDMRERIQRASERSSRSTLVAQLDAVTAAQDRLRANANARLTLDVMVLRLAGG
jgi:DNA polymerase-3 subunit delta'